MTIDTIEISSGTMDYLKFGQGEEKLVIIPGLSVRSVLRFADAIAEAYELLASEFTIYLLDRKSNPPKGYTLNEMASDTAEAIRALGIRRASVLGASQGGMIALTIAITQPDLVDKLVVCSTSARMEGAALDMLATWIELAKAEDAEGLYLAFGRAIYPSNVFSSMRSALLEEAAKTTSEELRRFVILAESARDFDMLDDLDKIACPVFAIGSKDDGVFGAEPTLQIAERLGNRPDFALHLYDGFGHAAYDLAPDFKERVLRFLKSR